LESRLVKIESDLKRIVGLLISGTLDEGDVKEQVVSLKREKAELSDRLESIRTASNIVALHPVNLAHYLRQVEALDKTINQAAAEGSEGSCPSAWCRTSGESRSRSALLIAL
jgi:hypothetical protein